MKIHTEITKEELKSKYLHGLRVKDLLEFIKEHNLPEDARVMIQRVEDTYFENNHWGVYLKEGEESYYCREWNKNIKNKEWIEEHPDIKQENLKEFTENDIRESMEQYHPAWCCVKYKDEDDLLFIDLHY